MGVLEQLLTKTQYDTDKTQYLVRGFTNGFELEFEGDRLVKHNSPNLRFQIGDKFELWEKAMKAVTAGCYAGPFEEIPYEWYIQSPIGLVPKDKGKKTRLIFHLSYPRGGDHISVNEGIPHESCTVKYPDFDQAVKLCLKAGKNCMVGKSDMSMAFRHMPLSPREWPLLILMAYHQETGQVFYFVDKCLSFGSAISCKIFQTFSDAVAHVVEHKCKKENVNYLWHTSKLYVMNKCEFS